MKNYRTKETNTTDSILSLDYRLKDSKQDDITNPFQGLQERKIDHIKINDSNDLCQFYIFGKEIGQGCFGTVHSVIEKVNNKEWAAKVINKTMMGSGIKYLKREILILKHVFHPHIIYLDRVYESPRKLYLIMEICLGNLYPVYKNSKPFSETIARRIISQLLSAVKYLHQHEIVHRDLKMENILLAINPDDPDDDYYIKLTDFGLSSIKSQSGFGLIAMLHEWCGTPVYMAPEVLNSQAYSHLCDTWSIGVILYMLIFGELPFYAIDENELFYKITNESPQFPSAIPHSDGVRSLIMGLLTKNPASRITAAEAYEHPWIRGSTKFVPVNDNVLEKMNKWRNDMMLPVDSDNELLVASKPNKVPSSRGSAASPASTTKVITKQPMAIPVTNIKFGHPTTTSHANKKNHDEDSRMKKN